MSFLHDKIVLVLNSLWQAIGLTTPAKAMVAMNSQTRGANLSAKAISIDYYQYPNGDFDFDVPERFIPLSFDEWIALPIRSFDKVIRTSKMAIRVPSVIITHYNKIPFRKPLPTKQSIWQRDNGICQVSGKVLTRKNASVDHLVPVSRNGSNSFKNMVLMDKKLNSLKGDRTLDEVGWSLIRKPVEPLPIPISVTIKNLRHVDWKWFLVDVR